MYTLNIVKSVKSSYTTISLLWPSNSGGKISVFYTLFGICNSICTLIWVWLQQTGLSKKKTVLKLELWQIKSEFFSKNYLYFWNMIWQDVVFLSLENQILFYLWQASILYLAIKIKVSCMRILLCLSVKDISSVWIDTGWNRLVICS